MLADCFFFLWVFLFFVMLGVLFNLGIGVVIEGYVSILVFCFFMGLFLVGIYLVGMKIVVDWYVVDLGKVLGYLVGVLVLGIVFLYLLCFIVVEVFW